MEKQTARFEAFSDGIFGVAITLLALEIGIKPYAGASDANLWAAILEKWPEYFTFFNSFATVLLIWMGHHRIIERLRVADHRIMLLNGLVLLLVVLFPYPTRLVGNFIGTPAQRTAVAFYCGFTGLISLSMLLLTATIAASPKLQMSPADDRVFFKRMLREETGGAAAYGNAAALAFYSSALALAITFVMWVFWAFSAKSQDERDAAAA